MEVKFSFGIEDLERVVRSALSVFLDSESLRVEMKGRSDFVTQIDKNVQTYIMNELYKLDPDIAFMGEEEGADVYYADRPIWILDPVDGTTNLVRNLKKSAISLALCLGDETLMGIVYDPYLDELFSAEKGKGAYLNGEKIIASDVDSVSKCVVGVGTAPYYRDLTDETFDLIKGIYKSALDVRRMGAASIDLAYVACGRFGAFAELLLSPWDFAAGKLLIKEAGGIITDLDGDELSQGEKTPVIAAGANIYKEFYSVVKNSLK